MPDDTPPAPLPLYLLHGALGDGAQCATLLPHLPASVAPALVEFEGHGGTPFADTPTLRIERLAAAVVGAMDHAGVARAGFFGYSMGGYVALWIARHHPERVAAIVTLGTRLRWSPEIAARETSRLDPITIRAKVPRFAAALEARHSAAGWETLLAATAAMMHAMGDAPPLDADALRGITAPVRLMVGDRDATVSLEETAEAREWLPRGELEVLPATPHPFEQAPAARVARSVAETMAAVVGAK